MKLDTFISFTDRAYALLTLPNGNVASRPVNQKHYGPSQEITAIANLINNSLLCTGNMSGEICLWSISSSKMIRKLAGHVTRVNALCGLPNGYLASAGHEFSIKLWNVTAERPLVETLRGHTGFVYSLTVLSNGYLGRLLPFFSIYFTSLSIFIALFILTLLKLVEFLVYS